MGFTRLGLSTSWRSRHLLLILPFDVELIYAKPMYLVRQEDLPGIGK